MFLDKTTAYGIHAAALQINHAVAALIPRGVEDANLREAGCLLTSALMHASGVSTLIREFDKLTVDQVIDIRNRIHLSFGAPGDWGGDLEQALRELYAMEVPAADAAPTSSS